MNQTAYFNIEDIGVNEVIGSVWLFALIGVIFIWLFCLKAKTPLHIPILFSVFWCAVCITISADLMILWIIAIQIVGFMFYYGISKLLR